MYCALNKNGQARAEALDISKTFDGVWHLGLYHKVHGHSVLKLIEFGLNILNFNKSILNITLLILTVGSFSLFVYSMATNLTRQLDLFIHWSIKIYECHEKYIQYFILMLISMRLINYLDVLLPVYKLDRDETTLSQKPF